MRRITLTGPAQRLCVYIGESDSWRGKPLYAAILEALKQRGLAGATVVRGVAGFGAHSHVIHTAAILRLSQDLPLRIEVVDTLEWVSEALEIIGPMVGEGLVTLEEVHVVRYTHRYLNPLPADRAVTEAMTHDAVAARSETSVAEAWRLMLERGVKTLPVVDERSKVVGMLTDDDLLERAGLRQRLSVARQLDAPLIEEELAALGASPLHVEQVMSQPAKVIRDTESLGHAARQMRRFGVKRLPVVDGAGKLVGVLSRVDVLRQVVDAGPTPKARAAGGGRTLGEVMSPTVPTVRENDGLDAIIAAFVETASHRLIVTSAEGQVVGLISDADVIARLPTAHQRGLLSALRGVGTSPPVAVTAHDIMSEGALTAPAGKSVVEGLRLAIPEGRKWIVVVDAEGRPLGLVDRTILLAAVTSGGD